MSHCLIIAIDLILVESAGHSDGWPRGHSMLEGFGTRVLLCFLLAVLQLSRVSCHTMQLNKLRKSRHLEALIVFLLKVFAGQCRLIELGFRQGGTAGFGLRRVLVDERGTIKAELKRGEHKSLQTDRVILMPGPEEEVAWVSKMYRWLIEEDLSFREIANRLNEAGIATMILYE